MENDKEKLIIFMTSYLPTKRNMSWYLPQRRNANILYHTQDCRKAKHPETLVTLYFTLRHNWRYKVANTVEPQLSLPTLLKSQRRGSHFRLTLEANASSIKNPLSNGRMYARVWRATVSSKSTSKVGNALLN